ncbi:hypothetical protein GCM10009557_29210 [Virgisporangium ochraceum]|uniref:Uncharacterized protein n=1 Tax=Virgisporangium ochraceum TaxID=65505 RepID=A0A8J4EJ06_9ACTN|nr:hypothetical protein Voc01_087140 [Virgisporangium ochraceum]
MLAGRAGWRRSAGSVSGNASTTTTVSADEAAASTTNTPCQPVQRSTTPPSDGARIGAVMGISSRRDSTRAKTEPLNRSRSTAVAMTPAAATATPCSTRAAASTTRSAATAHSSDATTCTTSPASSGRRRPSMSESGPTSRLPTAIPTIVAVMVSWTPAEVVARSDRIAGSAGR